MLFTNQFVKSYAISSGISDKAWILGPNDEIVTSYTVVDGRLRVDSCFQEDEEYESYDYES